MSSQDWINLSSNRDVLGTNASSSASFLDLTISGYLDQERFGMRFLGFVFLIISTPLIVVLMVLVRLTSKGPAIFRQERVGLHGKVFEIYKLRTMRMNAETETGPVWCGEDDQRITWLGRFLRRLHLDELPQFVNVALGQMALVGPRPERPEIVRQLAEQVFDYEARLFVRPGITGLAQVNQPPDQTIDCVRRKLALDLEYIHEATFWVDLRLVAVTFLWMIGIPARRTTRFFRLERVPKLTPPTSDGIHVPSVEPTSFPFAADSPVRPDARTGSLR